ncbi:hypothetical protein G432_00130 [Sphingomonas sp. MM-1]|uniref:GIY-YIG nuclease family protein n=1 Tax=Sphingomonas sp. MM-1 TaxID=745310 RepID=UPI0002C0CCEB|nr:GIY-YIG nuclease family protein [Sphingomonas sp. MM-1]AGH47756.1 hypothetical protein G432_00130 [Sphingomonas sp. MM-1]
MRINARKAAVAAYKERKVATGIYALHCGPAGQSWVGFAPDLSTIQNRLWFMLRAGGHRHAGLQRAWTAHGADSFRFEALEAVEEDVANVRDRVLKERRAHWSAKLGAEEI